MRDRAKEFTNGPSPSLGAEPCANASGSASPAAGAAPPRPIQDPAGGSPGGASSTQSSPAAPCPCKASGGAANAFSLPFLERLRAQEHPPTPETANAGPWSVEPTGRCEPSPFSEEPPEEPSTEPAEEKPAGPPEAGVVCHHVDALESRTLRSETEWVCLGAGEAGPRGTFERPDLAYLFAAALPLDGAPDRLRLNRQALDPGLYRSPRAGVCGARWYRLTEDGRPVGRLCGQRPELVGLANALVHLRSRPLALAHLLAACGEETLERTGRILDGLVRKGVS